MKYGPDMYGADGFGDDEFDREDDDRGYMDYDTYFTYDEDTYEDREDDYRD